MTRKDKDADSPIGKIFRNKKRQQISQDRNGKPPLKMSREILDQVDNDLGIQESEGPYIDKMLAEKRSMHIFTHRQTMFVCKKL